MPRTKGSKNKPKITNDFASQIAEKQSAKKAAAAEISSITANIDALKADLKTKNQHTKTTAIASKIRNKPIAKASPSMYQSSPHPPPHHHPP